MSDNPHYPPERIAALKEAGKNTQIGQPNAGTIPGNHGGCPPHSIQKAIRYLGRQPVKHKDGKIKIELPDVPTPFQLVAANALTLAASGNMKAIHYVTDRSDGKVIQTNVNADFERLQSMSDEELHAELARLQRAAGSEDIDGTSEAEGSNEASAEQATAVQRTDPAPSV